MPKRSNKSRTGKNNQDATGIERREKKVVDTIEYEVEKIVRSTLADDTIYYEVKWLGYSEKENTQEPEYRLNCDEALLKFIHLNLNPDEYIKMIPKAIDSVEMMKNKKDILALIDPITSIAQMTVLGGSVKFVNVNTVSNKFKYLKYLISNNQSYTLNSFHIPHADQIDENMDRYRTELDLLQSFFPDYPKVKIVLPRQSGTTFYSPPLLSNLLFESATEEMLDKREQLTCPFIRPSNCVGFNKVKPFVEPFYFRALHRGDSQRINRHKRTNFRADPRFTVELKLTQQSACGWTLQLEDDVEKDTPLCLMTGVIRPCRAAATSLETEGERVAFSSFIRIPGTDMCLDRREFHDFSKYIPHSCEPTCGVRLVNSGKEFPDLVIYSLHDIDISHSHAITLDYFKMFDTNVKEYFVQNKAPDGNIFHLYDNSIDFVQCLCLMPECRNVLHLTNKRSKSSKKRVKLSGFGGLELVESTTVFTIKEGVFVK